MSVLSDFCSTTRWNIFRLRINYEMFQDLVSTQDVKAWLNFYSRKLQKTFEKLSVEGVELIGVEVMQSRET